MLKEYLDKHEIRYFEHFPKGLVCPICKTNEDTYTVLLPIDGTLEGNNEEAVCTHLHCAIAQRCSKEVGNTHQILYKVIK